MAVYQQEVQQLAEAGLRYLQLVTTKLGELETADNIKRRLVVEVARDVRG